MPNLKLGQATSIRAPHTISDKVTAAYLGHTPDIIQDAFSPENIQYLQNVASLAGILFGLTGGPSAGGAVPIKTNPFASKTIINPAELQSLHQQAAGSNLSKIPNLFREGEIGISPKSFNLIKPPKQSNEVLKRGASGRGPKTLSQDTIRSNWLKFMDNRKSIQNSDGL